MRSTGSASSRSSESSRCSAAASPALIPCNTATCHCLPPPRAVSAPGQGSPPHCPEPIITRYFQTLYLGTMCGPNPDQGGITASSPEALGWGLTWGLRGTRGRRTRGCQDGEWRRRPAGETPELGLEKIPVQWMLSVSYATLNTPTIFKSPVVSA